VGQGYHGGGEEMRIGSAIQDLATSEKRNDVFLAALSKKTVYVWNTAISEMVAEFDTIMDFGGQRLALANSRDIFIAGAYTRYGIACYDLVDGQILWHRKDLKGVQKIRISPDDKTVFCGFSDKPGHFLDLDTGTTLEKLRSVKDIFFDTIQGWVMHYGLPDRNKERPDHPYQAEVYDSQRQKQITVSEGYFFNAAFSPSHVAVADGDLLFISRQDPDKKIIYRPPAKYRIHDVTYTPKTGVFLGVQHNYENYVASTLLRFDLSLDEPITVAEINRSEKYAFCDLGQHLITSEGQYINTITGIIEKELVFPQREYNN
jgi:hypothetical protein